MTSDAYPQCVNGYCHMQPVPLMREANLQVGVLVLRVPAHARNHISSQLGVAPGHNFFSPMSGAQPSLEILGLVVSVCCDPQTCTCVS